MYICNAQKIKRYVLHMYICSSIVSDAAASKTEKKLKNRYSSNKNK